MLSNPFASSSSRAGHGSIVLAILEPCSLVLQTLSYQYPLKLVSPAPLHLPYASSADPDVSASSAPASVHTVFILTYGGGLVAGDQIALDVKIPAYSRLTLLTQGSTKIFKAPSRNIVTRQSMSVALQDEASLLYLPDPVQPFGSSCFEQRQIYELHSANANLCVCDWVCAGRPARGETWSLTRYISRNEIWRVPADRSQRSKLLLRDNLILEDDAIPNVDIATQMHGMGVYGTLILGGKLFSSLANLFLNEFVLLPRIGSRQWDANPPDEDHQTKYSSHQMMVATQRAARIDQEKRDGLLWTASSTRGYVVVKFGAREVQGAKQWLMTMLKTEGTIEQFFGTRALMCLR